MTDQISLGVAHKLYTENNMSLNGFTSTVQNLSILDLVILVFAIYLALKCKRGRVLQIVLAILFSPCFVAYRLFKPCS